MLLSTVNHLAHSDTSAGDNQNWVRCYLGLGSNLATELGSPIEHIHHALTALGEHGQVRNLQSSSYYASKPMGPQDQPDFINAVVGFETILSTLELLDVCQHLESEARRARLRHWGERSLDVDVLLYGQAQINETRLIIPHVGLTERNFVLVPLREIAPELIISGKSIDFYPLSADWTDLKRLDVDINNHNDKVL